ncbi:peptide deformylase [cf. Phormidesmis sp. LEGE 11477]|uniref:peptide deformylase n=1 Tax=cf. Phormidesmis sp. LEGE 11477 TaxID=1828680 RepID=UPI001880C12F|nr:peptide deformylase [cf. Phormidesmis sp. LEGE 11477]MBE9063273.1 peptide deformylase [cf. Phormidesmis sp. LEGE 11477]
MANRLTDSSTGSLTIAELGNPVLRSPAKAVSNIQDPAFQQLIDDLISTTIECNGVGIAAPQVSQSLRLFIVASRPNIRYLHAPKMAPTPMINPQILSYSDAVVMGWEGCLSVPGLRGLVKRSKEIEVLYTDRHGQQQQRTFTDFVARIIQHEYDHINGKVFLDRVESTLDLMSEAEYHSRIVCG